MQPHRVARLLAFLLWASLFRLQQPRNDTNLGSLHLTGAVTALLVNVECGGQVAHDGGCLFVLGS